MASRNEGPPYPAGVDGAGRGGTAKTCTTGGKHTEKPRVEEFPGAGGRGAGGRGARGVPPEAHPHRHPRRARAGLRLFVDGVEEPLGELAQLRGGRLRLLLQPPVVLAQVLHFGLEHRLVLLLLGGVHTDGVTREPAIPSPGGARSTPCARGLFKTPLPLLL